MSGLFRFASVLVLVAIQALASASGVWANQDEIIADGLEEYLDNCAACHGPEGLGDGKMAKMLLTPPLDLTGIAERNGGEFPFWRIYETIDGRDSETIHGTFQMPIFGERFRGQEKIYGYDPTGVRILLLTHYLQSIQKP